MEKRAGKLEMATREKEITALIAIGFTKKQISEELSKKFNVSAKSIERQYERIINNWVELDKDKLDHAKAAYIMQLSYLYKKAENAGQYKVAADIVEKQAKLMGLYKESAQTEEKKPEINIVKKSLAVVPAANDDD